MKDPYAVIVKPVITEDATRMSERGQYAFKVQINSSKAEIRKAIEKAFNVKVRKVNTQVIGGEMKRVRYQLGKRADWKKAIVTLEEGQKLELY
jgi:large subunit ribosomal protein L23